MTEEQAKTKWCPFARAMAADADGRTSGSGNRWDTNDDDTKNEFGGHNACIGSACMAWRWNDTPNPEYDKHPGNLLAQYPPPPMVPMYVKIDTNGHCGLAGKP